MPPRVVAPPPGANRFLPRSACDEQRPRKEARVTMRCSVMAAAAMVWATGALGQEGSTSVRRDEATTTSSTQAPAPPGATGGDVSTRTESVSVEETKVENG